MKDVPLFLQGILFSSYLHCPLIVYVSILANVLTFSHNFLLFSKYFNQFSIYFLSPVFQKLLITGDKAVPVWNRLTIPVGETELNPNEWIILYIVCRKVIKREKNKARKKDEECWVRNGQGRPHWEDDISAKTWRTWGNEQCSYLRGKQRGWSPQRPWDRSRLGLLVEPV